MKAKKETAANKYRYTVNTPEPSFERYIDDMGALVIDFYSVQEGLTIGTSKIIVKLYIKRHNDSSRNVFCSQLLLVLLSEKGLMLLLVQKRIS